MHARILCNSGLSMCTRAPVTCRGQLHRLPVYTKDSNLNLSSSRRIRTVLRTLAAALAARTSINDAPRHCRSSGLPTYNSDPLDGPLQGAPGVCASSTGVNPDIVTLQANSSTVHWGYYYAGASPQLVINSGDTVNVEMVRIYEGTCWCNLIC